MIRVIGNRSLFSLTRVTIEAIVQHKLGMLDIAEGPFNRHSYCYSGNKMTQCVALF